MSTETYSPAQVILKSIPNPPLSWKQLDFLADSEDRYIVIEGAVRSGKTFVAILKWFLFILSAPQGGRLIMVGRTKSTVWRNLIEPMMDESLFGDFAKAVKGNNGADQIHVFGRRVDIIGASDRLSENNIRGATVVGAMVDEITVLNQGFIKQLLNRTKKLIATTNPDNPSHWFKTDYLDRIGAKKKPAIGWRRWSFDMYDNPSMTPEEREVIESQYSGLFYRRFVKGEWVAGEGAVFDMWNPNYIDDPKDPGFVVKHKDLPPMQRLYCMGVDFGTTHATSAIVVGLGMDSRLYLVNEWRYEADEEQGNPRLTNSMMASALKQWLAKPLLPDHIERGQKPEMIFVDGAAASFFVELQAQGFSNLDTADKRVSYGIGTMASLFSQGNLRVSDRCAGFIKEAPGYSWDSTVIGADQVVKVNDDSLDAARYAIVSSQSEWYGNLREISPSVYVEPINPYEE